MQAYVHMCAIAVGVYNSRYTCICDLEAQHALLDDLQVLIAHSTSCRLGAKISRINRLAKLRRLPAGNCSSHPAASSSSNSSLVSSSFPASEPSPPGWSHSGCSEYLVSHWRTCVLHALTLAFALDHRENKTHSKQHCTR